MLQDPGQADKSGATQQRFLQPKDTCCVALACRAFESAAEGGLGQLKALESGRTLYIQLETYCWAACALSSSVP